MLSWLFLGGFGGYGGYGGGYGAFGGYPGALTPALQPIREPDPYTEQRLHSLELACAGLWQLLKDKNGYTDQELMDLIHKVDQQRSGPPAPGDDTQQVCPKCGHKMLTRNHGKCLWCGADLQPQPFT